MIYGSKTLTMKELLILATIFAILGAFFLGRAVSETIGKNILYIEITTALVLTILISTAIWLIISSALGLPISTTHATIGSIVGIGIFLGGWNDGLNWQIINGEKIGGCCILYVDESIDTGDIIRQELYTLGLNDTAKDIIDLQLKLFPEMLLKTVEELENGTVQSFPQNRNEGCYYTRRYPRDGKID